MDCNGQRADFVKTESFFYRSITMDLYREDAQAYFQVINLYFKEEKEMALKILAAIIALVMVFLVGYMIVNSVINLFEGYPIGEAFSASWYDITHLWGIIKDKVADIEYPMTNSNITWEYAMASIPR